MKFNYHTYLFAAFNLLFISNVFLPQVVVFSDSQLLSYPAYPFMTIDLNCWSSLGIPPPRSGLGTATSEARVPPRVSGVFMAVVVFTTQWFFFKE